MKVILKMRPMAKALLSVMCAPTTGSVTTLFFAENEGLIEGYADGLFRPNAINRAEALVILMNIADITEDDTDFSSGDISPLGCWRL